MEYPDRKLHRLKSWDYRQAGYYHITICTQNKQKILCNIHQSGLDVMVEHTSIGKMIMENWEKLAHIYPNVQTDYFCLMPNHLHGILIVQNGSDKTLGDIVRGFKSVTTRTYNKMVSTNERNTLWQASFYDEIIRDDEMLYDVRKYIFGNPSKWLEDDLYVK